MLEEVYTEQSPDAVGPYSQAIKMGNLVVTSGQIPFTAEGELVSEDIQKQAEKSLENVKHILQEAGTGMDKVVKCRVFLDDIDDFPQVNEVYKKFFSQPFPARSCVEVANLPKGVKIEIEAMAELD